MLSEKLAAASVFLFAILTTILIANPVDREMDFPLPELFSNKCYEDLGCFYTGPPFFHPPYRMISLEPWSPDEMGTKFHLFTPNQKDKSYVLEPNRYSLWLSKFNASSPTIVIITGYLSDYSESHDDEYCVLKNFLLEKRDYNILIVDWSNSNKGLYYQAIANARMAGAQIAQMIRFLVNEADIKPESVHLIGLSLGGQVAGYAGEKIPNLGRITGLDTAGTLFEGTDSEVHLDHTDALFVDAIHTGTGLSLLEGFGYVAPYGHIDFFPNGGHRQPMCVNYTTPFGYSLCSHLSSLEYFTQSVIDKNCSFVGRECSNKEDYDIGCCDSNLEAVMGFEAKPIPGLEPGHKFFLTTSVHLPFCVK